VPIHLIKVVSLAGMRTMIPLTIAEVLGMKLSMAFDVEHTLGIASREINLTV